MTPQGLVKVMNRYLSTMSEPIRAQQGIIDKYIGDAIMAYWGPPFTDEAEQARLACLAAIDMMDRMAACAKNCQSCSACRTIPTECDVAHRHRHRRSAGRQHRLRIHDELYGHGRYGEPRLAAGVRQQVLRHPMPGFEATIAAAAQAVEAREIDRLVVAGQTRPQTVFEIMGRAGELSAERSHCDAIFRGACRIPGAPLGRCASCLSCGARSGPWRRAFHGPCRSCRRLRG